MQRRLQLSARGDVLQAAQYCRLAIELRRNQFDKTGDMSTISLQMPPFEGLRGAFFDRLQQSLGLGFRRFAVGLVLG